MNSKCSWYNTGWSVQIRPDGSIPRPDTRPRTTRVYLPSQEEIDAITRAAERTHDASMRPGGEIRR